jgi:hypothetical protein
MPGRHETAQICLNGHVITPGIVSLKQGTQHFCDRCGKRTITKCPSCKGRIKGMFRRPDMNILLNYEPPIYCSKCGKAFSWTKARLGEARKLVDVQNVLSKEEKIEVKNSLKNILKTGSKTNAAARIIKKVSEKIGPDVTSVFRSILSNIAVQEAKEIIWGHTS